MSYYNTYAFVLIRAESRRPDSGSGFSIAIIIVVSPP